MKEAMKTFLEEVWRTIELEDIIADVDPRNEASVGMLKKFGFEEAGYRENTFETHLGWCDSLDLKLNRPKEENAEWALRKNGELKEILVLSGYERQDGQWWCLTKFGRNT